MTLSLHAVASEINEISDWWDDGYERDGNYVMRFKVTPSLVFRSPKIVTWKRHNGGFYLFAEPGLILSPGASGSHKAEWLNWDFKAGVNLQADRFLFYIGYGVSNFSLYSGFPYSYRAESDRDRYTTHSGFIGCAYKF